MNLDKLNSIGIEITLPQPRDFPIIVFDLKGLSDLQLDIFCDHIVSFKNCYEFKNIRIIGEKFFISAKDKSSKEDAEEIVEKISKHTKVYPEYVIH